MNKRPYSYIFVILLLFTIGLMGSFAQPREVNASSETVFLPASQQLTPQQQNTLSKNFSHVSGDLLELEQEFRAFQNQGVGSFSTTNSAILLSGPNNTFVTIDAVAAVDSNTLLSDLQALGLQNGAAFGRMVSGRLPINAVRQLDGLASLNFARPAYPITNVGLVTSQGDAAQRSDDARAIFGIDGSGITIGTLSDSYNCLGGAATDVTNNDLPSGINVVDDTACPGSDEGRAMMQIIHDVAPGSSQSFHTAFNGMADFAQGIIDLQNAGADIIVDDVGYLCEPMFQDGVIAQAVDTVVGNGAAYFSAAGNGGRRSYESAFRGSGITGSFGELHDFNPGAGVDTMQNISLNIGSTIRIALQWDQPVFDSNTGSPGSSNDIDLFLLDSGGTVVAQSINFNVGSDPCEVITFTNFGPSTTFNIAIEKFSGSDPSLLKYVIIRGSVTVNEFVTNSSTSYGHPNAAGAESVGAADYRDTPEFGQSPPIRESFSSAGGTPILFDPAGNAITPIIRGKPEIVAPDNGNTTFFISGFNPDGDGFPNFPGTSAAAPHAAAVAALMLDENGSLTPNQIYDALEMTAIDMGPAGFDFDTGFGLIDAVAATTAIQSGGGSPPPNDDFDNAIMVSALPFNHAVNTISATDAFDDPIPSCGFNVGKTVWYEFTPSTNGTFQIDTFGSNFDTVLSIFTGSRGSLTEVACNDDSGAGLQSRIDLAANAGTSYQVMIGGFDGESGFLNFNVNDISLPAGPVLISPSNGATVENNRAQFRWQKNRNAAMYEIRLDTVNPPVFSIETRKNSYKPRNGVLPTTLFWQVRALDSNGNPISAWSEVRSVNAVSSSKATPILNAFATATPTLTWNRISWATEYEIQIDVSSKFDSSALQVHNVSASTFSVIPAPLADGIWSWRIRARQPDGRWGKWNSNKGELFIINTP